VSRRVPADGEAATRLHRVEGLLNQAISELTSQGSSTSGGRPDVLAEAARELRLLQELITKKSSEQKGFGVSHDPMSVALIPQMKAILPKLARLEKLWASAAEFYRGWCAVEPPQSYPSPCMETASAPSGPALLAFEG
jgi:hypothetical protein